jgi:hypothetical protein
MQIALESGDSLAFPGVSLSISENDEMTGFKTKVAEAMSPILDVFHSVGEAPLDHVRTSMFTVA